MKSKYKIGIWGQFGDGGRIADGQAVRTTVITEELKKRYGKENICTVNTNNWKRHPFSFFVSSVKLLKDCEKTVIFPADNGFRIIVPIYDFFNFFFKKKLYNVVIGGYLPALLKGKPGYVKMLKKYEALFVQTGNLKRDLEEIGLDNIRILSNPKRLNTRKESDIEVNMSPDITVCTFSRINAVKGIGEALEAVRLANRALGQDRIKIHLYGTVPDDYIEEFDRLLEKYKDIAEYKGIADYDKTVETLTPYFALMFPTYYYGEGFPGCVVDAYNTGLPIIATDWNYNGDVIKNDVNGILVQIKDPEALSTALLRLYNDREYHRTMALNNLREAKNYSPDVVLAEFYEYMDE